MEINGSKFVSDDLKKTRTRKVSETGFSNIFLSRFVIGQNIDGENISLILIGCRDVTS